MSGTTGGVQPDVPFLGLIEHTNMLPKEWYGGNNVLYMANYLDRSDALFKMSKDELVDLYLPHLTKFNPEFDHSCEALRSSAFFIACFLWLYSYRATRLRDWLKTPQ